jgi:5-methylcytosine-specific restriction protein A
MATFLLTWNPIESSVAELLAAWRRHGDGKGVQPTNWSCGSNKSIPTGARVFLHRQAREPRGIVASGWVTRQSYRAKHWDTARARKGDEANYVDWWIDAVCEGFRDDDEDRPLNIAPLPVHAITQAPIGTEVHWGNIPGSGIQIPKAAAEEIERLWATHVSAQVADEVQGETLSAIEGDPKQRLVWSRSREASLRSAKLRSATRKSPDGLLRCEVPGCGFCFETVYGELGKGFAHVHHLNALAGREKSAVTTLEDLVIVCANCHAMIHRHGKCRSLPGLISHE